MTQSLQLDRLAQVLRCIVIWTVDVSIGVLEQKLIVGLTVIGILLDQAFLASVPIISTRVVKVVIFWFEPLRWTDMGWIFDLGSEDGAGIGAISDFGEM